MENREYISKMIDIAVIKGEKHRVRGQRLTMKQGGDEILNRHGMIVPCQIRHLLTKIGCGTTFDLGIAGTFKISYVMIHHYRKIIHCCLTPRDINSAVFRNTFACASYVEPPACGVIMILESVCAARINGSSGRRVD